MGGGLNTIAEQRKNNKGNPFEEEGNRVTLGKKIDFPLGKKVTRGL